MNVCERTHVKPVIAAVTISRVSDTNRRDASVQHSRENDVQNSLTKGSITVFREMASLYVSQCKETWGEWGRHFYETYENEGPISIYQTQQLRVGKPSSHSGGLGFAFSLRRQVILLFLTVFPLVIRQMSEVYSKLKDCLSNTSEFIVLESPFDLTPYKAWSTSSVTKKHFFFFVFDQMIRQNQSRNLPAL